MMHLIHRNRVIETRAARFCFRCGPPSPAGKAHQGAQKWMIDQDGCTKQAFPAGEGGRQIVKSSATLFRDEI
jgi:hypothetical protein